jgi:uncharacterized protein with FMN-binding domain
MSSRSTRLALARKAATVAMLAPPVIAMASSCTRPHHRPRPGGDNGTRPDVSRPTRPSTSEPSTTITTIMRPSTTRSSPPPTIVTTRNTVPVTTRPPVTTVTTAPRPTTPPTTAPAGPKTVTGPVVRHQHGPVQVTVAITGNRITDVRATAPDDSISALINGNAVPKLNAAVLQAQSANVTGISGATLTSNAYKRSLQAALDQAGFGR